MKTKLEIQYNDTNVLSVDVEKVVKDDLKDKGVKMNTVDVLEIFYQPQTGSIYYLANLTDETSIKSDALKI